MTTELIHREYCHRHPLYQIIDRLSGVSGHLPEPNNSFREDQSLDRIEKIKADLELRLLALELMRKNILTTDISSIQKYVEAHGPKEEVKKYSGVIKFKAQVLSGKCLRPEVDISSLPIKPLHEYVFLIDFNMANGYETDTEAIEGRFTVTPEFYLVPKDKKMFTQLFTCSVYLSLVA